MNATSANHSFASSRKSVTVECQDYTALSRCIRELVLIGPSYVSGCLGCQTVVPSFLKHKSEEWSEGARRNRASCVRRRYLRLRLGAQSSLSVEIRIGFDLGVNVLAIVIVIGEGVVDGG